MAWQAKSEEVFSGNEKIFVDNFRRKIMVAPSPATRRRKTTPRHTMKLTADLAGLAAITAIFIGFIVFSAIALGLIN